ncbi:MAG: spermidine/putrescine ABC transporter substrate-binding protein [Opitutaceae bacterium]|nr:spermidine/putrescine ABC transporter substrate-binding protein [Opitutaceae bacterium]
MKHILRSLAVAGATLVAAVGSSLSAAELNLFAWSEYVPQAVLDKFTEETGIKVNYETYDSNEEMLSKLVGGAEYDLVQPSEYVIEVMVKRGMLAPIDFAAVPNFKNLDKAYLNLPHDPEQKFSIPYMVGSVGIVVNTEKVKEPVKGYADLFSGKHAGRIVTLDDNRELLTWAFYFTGQDLNTINKDTMAKARPVLAKWLPQIKIFDSASPKTALLNGEVDLGIVWSGEAAILFQEDKKFQYVLPTEGAHLFIDSLAMPKDAPHKKEAHAFLNFILRPDISVLISADFPYTNPNVEARKLLTPEQLENPASYPAAEDAKRLHTFRDIGRAAAEIDKMITDLRGGS